MNKRKCAYRHCDNEFMVKPHGGRHLYCSPKCAKLERAAVESAKKGKNPRGVPPQLKPRMCPHCGKVFKPKKGKQKLCSLACAYAANRAPRVHTQLQGSDTPLDGWKCVDCGCPSDTYRCPPCKLIFDSKRGESEGEESYGDEYAVMLDSAYDEVG